MNFSLPKNASFYVDLVNVIDPFASNHEEENSENYEMPSNSTSTSVLTLFSKYDAIELGRVVGTKRASHMIKKKGKSAFN